MIVLFVLALVYVLLLVLDRLGVRPAVLRSHRASVRVSLAAMFLFAATSRLFSPEMLLQMIPPMLPLRYEALYLTGVLEAFGAVGLLVPRLRRAAGVGLAMLLLAVLPANLYVALFNVQIDGYPGSPLYQWARIPIQAALIWLVLWASRAVSRSQAAQPRVPVGAHS